jgi:hypothetical protein
VTSFGVQVLASVAQGAGRQPLLLTAAARTAELRMFGFSTRKYCLLLVFFILLFALALEPAAAQTSNQPEVSEYWPSLVTTVELGSRFRLQTRIENHTGLDSRFTQWELGTTLSYRTMRRLRLRRRDNDEENKYDLTIGAGYMFVQSNDHDVVEGEHRILVEATPKHSLGLGFLLQDRNRLEFRWREEGYDFRYRNRLMIDRPLRVRGFDFIPYASGELFWSRNAHRWDENRSSFGVWLPYRKSVMLDLYYLRKNCSGCGRPHTDAFGITLSVYFLRKKS